MERIRALINEAKRKTGVRNDSEFARRIGVSRQTVSHWMTGRHIPNERTAAKLAEIAGTDPAQALMIVQEARAKTTADRKFWRRQIKQD